MIFSNHTAGQIHVPFMWLFHSVAFLLIFFPFFFLHTQIPSYTATRAIFGAGHRRCQKRYFYWKQNTLSHLRAFLEQTVLDVKFLLWSAQEYLQSCQELMEEVLHFNVTEPPTSKVENGCSPSTPTDLQEIHFWQRHFRVCQKTFIVCACLPYVCKYCKINDWNLLKNLLLRYFSFSTCSLSAPALFLRLFFYCRTCELLISGSFLEWRSRQLSEWPANRKSKFTFAV